MSQKGKQVAGAAKGKKAAKSGPDGKADDVLQAVVLADSFQDRFKPFTIEKPRCLLPLANVPLIEYTLEFLAMNAVQEVYIYCGNHTEQVEEYIDQSRWTTTAPTSPFSVLQFVRVSDARSIGDVLRDMDTRSLVQGDFILVHGDLVSNIMLDKTMAAHKKRRETSALNIMTMVLTSGGQAQHRTKTKGVTPIFAIDSTTQRCLHYEEMHPLQTDHYLSLDPAVPDELSADFEMRADLIDAQIDICTPEVLALWSESFDYDLPRRDFLHGVLKDWELNGKMIYAEVLKEGYAARASNLQMYDAISRDVLGRWTSPFIPENNIMPRHSYQKRSNGAVLGAGASIANSTRVSNTILGHQSTIGPRSRVSGSIIGDNCRIGADVTVENCYIWSDTTVGDGARVARSIVADAAAIGTNSFIAEGSVISFGVIVGDDITLSNPAILSAVDTSGEPVPKGNILLGPSSNAAPFVDPDDDDLEEDDPVRLQKSLIYNHPSHTLSTASISTLASSAMSDEETDGLAVPGDTMLDRPHRPSDASSDGGISSFHTDAAHGLLDALRADTGDFDSAKLEFMGLRLANNASDSMMSRAVATAFARRAAELQLPENGGLEPTKAATQALTARGGAAKFVKDVGVGGGREAEQVEFVLALQRALKGVKGQDLGRLGTLLAALLQQLYALDITEEEGILAWWGDSRAQDGEDMRKLKEKCAVLVEWLENAEEEDDDDDDDDE